MEYIKTKTKIGVHIGQQIQPSMLLGGNLFKI